MSQHADRHKQKYTQQTDNCEKSSNHTQNNRKLVNISKSEVEKIHEFSAFFL